MHLFSSPQELLEIASMQSRHALDGPTVTATERTAILFFGGLGGVGLVGWGVGLGWSGLKLSLQTLKAFQTIPKRFITHVAAGGHFGAQWPFFN